MAASTPLRELVVLGVPSTAGAFSPGQERAPAALREAHLLELLGAGGRPVRDGGDVVPPWRWRPDRARPRAQHVEQVAATVAAVADAVAATVADGAVALVLGGDCTVGVGTVLGVRRHGPVALVYLDQHPDLNTPASVPTGTLDWMGVAHLLGEPGTEAAVLGGEPPLAPADVVLLGTDPEHSTEHERARLDALGLARVPHAELAADPAGAAARALELVAPDAEHVVVHFDVDVVEFTDAPLSENVGRGEGVPLDAALAAFAVLARDPRLAAVTLTELNPLHGEEDGASLRRLVDGLATALTA
jgi:arginase